jgi:hypothetical protein
VTPDVTLIHGEATPCLGTTSASTPRLEPCSHPRFFFFLLVGLGFEFRTLCLKSRYSTALSHTSSSFCSGYFGGAFQELFVQAGLKPQSY